jgi:hypothetical protein
MTEPAGPPTRRLDERGLADTRAALDYQHPAPLPQQLLYRCQLALTLKQPLHDITLGQDGAAARTRRPSAPLCPAWFHSLAVQG